METDEGQGHSPACDDTGDLAPHITARRQDGAPKKPTRSEQEALLLDMEIEDACRIKWNWGVREHRGGDASKPFNGDRVVEVHSEGLDVLLYLPGIMEELGHIPAVHECLEEAQSAGFKLVRAMRMVNELRDEYLLAKNGEG